MHIKIHVKSQPLENTSWPKSGICKFRIFYLAQNLSLSLSFRNATWNKQNVHKISLSLCQSVSLFLELFLLAQNLSSSLSFINETWKKQNVHIISLYLLSVCFPISWIISFQKTIWRIHYNIGSFTRREMWQAIWLKYYMSDLCDI